VLCVRYNVDELVHWSLLFAKISTAVFTDWRLDNSYKWQLHGSPRSR